MEKLFWLILFVVNFRGAIYEDNKFLKFISIIATICSAILLATS